jgi:hypothetical protein
MFKLLQGGFLLHLFFLMKTKALNNNSPYTRLNIGDFINSDFAYNRLMITMG